MIVKWWAERARVGEPGKVAPFVRAVVHWLIGPLVTLAHRPTIEGLENLPPTDPYLLVANHSGALAVAELLSLATLWLKQLGSKPLAAMAHAFGFVLWPASFFVRGLGAIPATKEHAAQALQRGVSLLSFPGGGHESSRPFWRANEVDFGGHRGFLRIAHANWVPIVPMRIRGSHLSSPVLWQSRRVLPALLVVPRLFGVRQYPLTLLGVGGAVLLALFLPAVAGWPLTIAAIWAFLAGPLSFLPIIPVSIRFVVGAPIDPGALFSDRTELGEDELERALATIEETLRDLR